MEPDTEGFGSTAQKLSSNPLGIIALFIVLVYAMAALVLGVAGGNLDANQRWPLVWFLVAFPMIVLAVFSWLVSKHHTKLYAPRDYPSEEGFFRALTPEEQREKLREEAREVTETSTRVTEAHGSAATAHAAEPGIEEAASRVFLAEGLVFRLLELEFGGSSQRQVGVGRDHGFDGVIISKGGPVFVEVKYISSPKADSIRRAVESIKRAANRIPRGSRFILAVVTEGLTEEQAARAKAKARELIADAGGAIDLRIYDIEALGSKFGVAVSTRPKPQADA